MINVIKACCIMNKMVTEDSEYNKTERFKIDLDISDEYLTAILEKVRRPESTYAQAEIWRKTLDLTESKEEHAKLTSELMNYHWNRRGDSVESEGKVDDQSTYSPSERSESMLRNFCNFRSVSISKPSSITTVISVWGLRQHVAKGRPFSFAAKAKLVLGATVVVSPDLVTVSTRGDAAPNTVLLSVCSGFSV